MVPYNVDKVVEQPFQDSDIVSFKYGISNDRSLMGLFESFSIGGMLHEVRFYINNEAEGEEIRYY